MSLSAKAVAESMSSAEVALVIAQVSQARGKQKEKVLAEHFSDPLLQRVLRAAYDPFVTYGIKKVPEVIATGTAVFTESTFALLDDLAARRLTGNAAKTSIETHLASLEASSQDLLTKIIKKDLRGGFTANTCNRVSPGFIFVFECMLAHKFEEKRIKQWPVVAEPKYDGVRSLAIWDGKEVTFYSRVGNVFEGMKPIADAMSERLAMSKAPPMVFDGELMDAGNSFNKIVGDVHKKDFMAADAVYMMFDMVPWEAFNANSDNRGYRERRMALASLYDSLHLYNLNNVQLTPVKVCASVEVINDFAHEIMSKGGEGLIVKPLDGLYEKKRSYNWLKIKDEVSAGASIDLPVVGYKRGTGKYENCLGALVIDFNGVEVSVSGFTDAERVEIWATRDQVIGRLVEVKYHQITPDGSMRHPRFVRFRDDKPVEDGPGV